MSQQHPSPLSPLNTTNQLQTLPSFNSDVDASLLGDGKTPRPWWMRALFIAIIVILLAGVGGGLLLWQMGRSTPVTYQYQQVAQGDLTLNVSATGPIQSPATYNLTTATTAMIRDIQVKVGQRVKQGQVLAHLDATALQDAVNLAQATVNSDQDTLTNAQVNAGWIITPAVTQAQDTLNIAQKQLDAAIHNLANATLKAPHTGVVTQVNGTVGGAPGVPVNGSASTGSSAFIQIVDLSSLQIQANVNEADTANIRSGNPVQFTIAAYGNRIFQGTVNTISSTGVTNSNVVSYPVIIDINMPSTQNANVLPGMTASITITVVQHHNVLTIPVNAINFAHVAVSSSASGTPPLASQSSVSAAQSQANQWLNSLQQKDSSLASDNPLAAYIIEPAHPGKFTVKPVVLGLTDGTSYEVLQGLTTGEKLVVG